ncbi:MAG: DUF6588 family protein [Cytophagales bacterium]|nr:DUF6588 family protein [Cytophagales bacterium]
MKTRISLFALCGLFSYAASFAQPKELGRFFPAAAVTSGGAANVRYLVAGYVTPLAEDFGALANSAWYNTGENHKKFGFDLSVSVNTIFVSSTSNYFNIDNTKLTGVSYLGTLSGSIPAPTAYGPESDIPSFTYNGGPNAGLGFNGTGGGNISKDVPIGSLVVPTLQGGIGLVKNTDLRFRFTPAVTISGTELKSWGVGIQHDIKQHFPGIKLAPFSMSVLVAYSKLTVTTSLGGLYNTAAGSGTFAGQEAVGETSAYTAQLLISKSVPVVTFYGGLGFNSATTTYAVNGSYYVDKAKTVVGDVTLSPVTIKDPYSQEFSTSGFRATGGIRLKFGPFFLNGDYTYFKGKGLLTTGLGLTVR